ncbi:MAG: nucleotidyltransferase domain-containing protein [Patescibacteria group bacterium]|nr:nucleotidyltransferase domain-containing protein [Patescibacteria group bacterium]
MNRTLSEKRWKKADLVSWYLQMVPFIRLVAVTGSMSYGTIKPSSDIDMFIIAKAGRIWTCRAFCRSLLKFIGQLRTGEAINERAGKICPNRFVTNAYLVINPQNSYHAQDYTQMVPMFDVGGLYQKFIIANKWMEKFGYFRPKKALNLVHSHSLTNIRKFLEWALAGKFGAMTEKNLREKHLKALNKKYPNINQPGSSIIANDNEIRIHPHERS